MRSNRFFPEARLLLCLLLASCGGGSGGGGGGPTVPPPAPLPPPPPPIVVPGANVASVSIDAGPANSFNLAFASVTLCAPGNSASCQTIDHVQLDTGSSGLRIVSSVLSPSMNLPAQTVSTNPVAECMQFADGFSWGSVKLADVTIGNETVSSLPVQIIGDPAFATIPADCASVGAEEDTVMDLGANGILGVGNFLQDCGVVCASNATIGLYYVCPSTTTCTQTTLATNLQVANPVAAFAADNNGVVIQLPALTSAGAPSAMGSLVFGIGTQSNNGLGGATIIDVDPVTGFFTTTFNQTLFPNSFIDAGSNVSFLPAGAIGNNLPPCGNPLFAGFLCPSPDAIVSTTNAGSNMAIAPASIRVGNAAALLSQLQLTAFNNLAAENPVPSLDFDYGLPFFFGRTIFVAFETRPVQGGGFGPFVAY